MVKCIDGVMVPKKGTTREKIVKRFTENCAAAGCTVVRVIHCTHIGYGSWRIVANVAMSEGAS